VLLHRSLGDDELRGDRTDRGRFGERVAPEQRATQRHEDIVLALRDPRRFRDCGSLGPVDGAAKHQPEPSEQDLVPRMERVLADDPASVDERAVAGTEIANAPRVAEPLEDGVDSGDTVLVHDHGVGLDGSDRHPLPFERSHLASASAPNLDVAAHRNPRLPPITSRRSYEHVDENTRVGGLAKTSQIAPWGTGGSARSGDGHRGSRSSLSIPRAVRTATRRRGVFNHGHEAAVRPQRFIPFADFFALLLMLAWIVVTSVVLARARREPAYVAAPGAA